MVLEKNQASRILTKVNPFFLHSDRSTDRRPAENEVQVGEIDETVLPDTADGQPYFLERGVASSNVNYHAGDEGDNPSTHSGRSFHTTIRGQLLTSF